MSIYPINARLVLLCKLFLLLIILCSCALSSQPDMTEKVSPFPTATEMSVFTSRPVCNHPICLIPSTVPGGRPFIDTWRNIHTFQTFTYAMDTTSIENTARAYDFVWGVEPEKVAAFRAVNSHAVLAYYIPVNRDSGTFSSHGDVSNRGLSYWKAYHPDWILYKCDRVTPVLQFGGQNISLDITNPDVLQWQVQMYARPASEQGYDALAVDNVNLDNGFGACGFYRNGQWHQQYTGQAYDLQWRQDMLNWIIHMQQAVHTLAHPLALIPNLGYNGNDTVVDPQTNQMIHAIAEHADGILDEAGFTKYGAGYLTGAAWLQLIQFMQSIQQQNKPYYIINETFSRPSSKADIAWALASYLMAKEHEAALFICEPQDYGKALQHAEYTAPIGVPQGEMYSAQNVYWRVYSGGLVIVNPGSDFPRTVTLPATEYTDLDGNHVSQTLTLSAHSALILLKH